MRGRTAAEVILALLLAMGLSSANSAFAEPEEGIAWITEVVAGFEKAAKEKKVLMICINAKNTPGERMETAAHGLREVVYKDPVVVAKSREFVCVFLTPEGSSEDYGEMRLRFGIEGDIVSPQHIFAHGEHDIGSKPLLRRQYWYYGSGEDAVKALLGLMDKALVAHRVQQNSSWFAGTIWPRASVPYERWSRMTRGATASRRSSRSSRSSRRPARCELSPTSCASWAHRGWMRPPRC